MAVLEKDQRSTLKIYVTKFNAIGGAKPKKTIPNVLVVS
jgi:hypothetical protein